MIVVQGKVREHEHGRQQVYFCLFTGCYLSWSGSQPNKSIVSQAGAPSSGVGRAGRGRGHLLPIINRTGLEGILRFSRSKIWPPQCPTPVRVSSTSPLPHTQGRWAAGGCGSDPAYMGPSCHWGHLETRASRAGCRRNSHHGTAGDTSPSLSGPIAPAPGRAGTPFPTISISTTPTNPVLPGKMDLLPCTLRFQCH